MQRVELHAYRIGQRHHREIANRRSQRVHPRNDPELRQQRKPKHQADNDVPRREDMRSPIGESTVEQGTHQEDNSGNDGDPIKLAQRSSHDVPSQMRIRQNLKRRRREDEGKEDQPADPGRKRQQHKKTKEGHVGRIIDSRTPV